MLTKQNILNIEKYKGRQVHLRRLFNKRLLKAGMKTPSDAFDDFDDSDLYEMDGGEEFEKRFKQEAEDYTCRKCSRTMKKRDFKHSFTEDLSIVMESDVCESCVVKKQRRAASEKVAVRSSGAGSSSKKVSSSSEQGGGSSSKQQVSSSSNRRPLDDKTITIRTSELEWVARYGEGDRCTDDIRGFGGSDANGRMECQSQSNWKIVKMTPMDFLLMAIMIPETEPECKRIATVKELMKTHKPQIPYLEIKNIFNLPKVSGHSGRHRVYEFLRQGCKTIDVAILCQFSQIHLFHLNTENGKRELHIQAEDNTGIYGTINIVNLNQQSCKSDGNTFIVQPGEAVKEKKRKIIEMRRWSDAQEYTIVRERKRRKKQQKNKKHVDQY